MTQTMVQRATTRKLAFIENELRQRPPGSRLAIQPDPGTNAYTTPETLRWVTYTLAPGEEPTAPGPWEIHGPL